jgi:hypothetical protein
MYHFLVPFLLIAIGSLLLKPSNSDNFYLEGFENPRGLPGGPLDERGIPNLPFSTDTNRLSDGVSSTDPYSNISPEFPISDGARIPSSIQSDRYKHYVDYMANAALQGIAGYGAGDSLREDARSSITSQINYTQLPAPMKNFSVSAAIKWNPSGFAIQDGEYYSIVVENSQLWKDGGIEVNADGYESYFDAVSDCYIAKNKCHSYLKKKRRFTANWMSLICGIGQFVHSLSAVRADNEAATDWLPLDESILLETLFYVGQSQTFWATHTGELICFANDADTLYWNNAGQLNVTASRMSWPPTNITYYQAIALPACDSSTAVYANGGINVDNPVLACNPQGGGSGWSYDQISNETAHSYESGAPDYLSQ